LLNEIYLQYLGKHGENDDIKTALVSIHNAGLCNVIEAYTELKNNKESGVDFFLTRYVFEQSLPEMESEILPVMECVLNLVEEAGADLAAGYPLSSFARYCEQDERRPKEAVQIIEDCDNRYVGLLHIVLSSGSKFNSEYYLSKAIELASHQDIEIRKLAILSFRNLEYKGNNRRINNAFKCLQERLENESDDYLIAHLIRASFGLCKQSNFLISHEVAILIDEAVKKGGKACIHAISEIFSTEHKNLPNEMLDVIKKHLLSIDPKNKGTISLIDSGIAHLIESSEANKGIVFLETILLENSNEISMYDLSVTKSIISRNNKNLLDRLLTRWFLKSDWVLCDGISVIINEIHGNEPELSIDPNEIPRRDFRHLYFLARKTFGYLFYKPITITSIIVSILRIARDKKTKMALSDFLYDPVMMNYTGSAQDYLKKCVYRENKVNRRYIEIALDKIKRYLKGLHSVGELKELYPPQTHIDAYWRQYTQQMTRSIKDAEKKSVFANLFSKSVLLYGRKSIEYISDGNEMPKRMELPLQSHSVTMEQPRLTTIDDNGLNELIKHFRAERIINEANS